MSQQPVPTQPVVVRSISDLRHGVARARSAGQKIGFVPTMGALHAGHLSLARLARERADFVAVSVFVNPTQFAAGEDLNAYPRTLDDDVAACGRQGAALVWAPEEGEMYPAGAQTWVEVKELSRGLCASHRAGHFQGVATVCAKLFNAVRPDVAVFGEKDFQQLQVIRRMVQDLLFPVEIVAGPTVREQDGLAMSSRNRYMNAGERARAVSLSRALFEMRRLRREQGMVDVSHLVSAGRGVLEEAGIEAIDYLEVVDADTLAPLETLTDAPARALVAARLGSARLIDNVAL